MTDRRPPRTSGELSERKFSAFRFRASRGLIAGHALLATIAVGALVYAWRAAQDSGGPDVSAAEVKVVFGLTAVGALVLTFVFLRLLVDLGLSPRLVLRRGAAGTRLGTSLLWLGGPHLWVGSADTIVVTGKVPTDDPAPEHPLGWPLTFATSRGELRIRHLERDDSAIRAAVCAWLLNNGLAVSDLTTEPDL